MSTSELDPRASDRAFRGFDHIDTRVRSCKQAEAFYDRIMPELGLPVKRHAHVDAAGEWHEPTAEQPYNAVEYHERKDGRRPPFFIGFIEDAAMTPTGTRIAFRVADTAELNRWHAKLASAGAARIEWSDDPGYPALFFEDPCGTKLELCARNP